MDTDNNYCQKCSATLICDKKIIYGSDLCFDFQRNIRNDEDKRILEFIAKNYHRSGSIKNDIFIQKVIKLKDDRDKRLASELTNLINPILGTF